MELSNQTYEALANYFNELSHLGYKPYKDVYRLLSLIFIEEILYGPMSEMVIEKDYKDINNALYCLYGDCLIPYPSYLEGISTINKRVMDNFRITETNILREINTNLRTMA